MSDTPTTVTPPTAPVTPPTPNQTATNELISTSAGARWGAPIISLATLGLLAAALVVNALIFKDQQANTLIIGSVIANATTAVNFWMGSSHGSQKKDALAAAISLKGQNS